jgi:hypothetical protein
LQNSADDPLCSARLPASSEARDGSRKPDLAHVTVAAALGKRDADRRLVHIQSDVGDRYPRGPSPMHGALCRSPGATLDILHVERRAADHSANIGSKAKIETSDAI